MRQHGSADINFNKHVRSAEFALKFVLYMSYL